MPLSLRLLQIGCLLALSGLAGPARAQRAVPDRLVVLTFDDAALSHATYVAPLLRRYGFGATFFVCEFREPAFADKTKYLSWAQIRDLQRQGFEIGSHTLSHRHVNKMSAAQLGAELDSIEARCRLYKIPRPTTFAYPGYDTAPTATAVLTARGYGFARAGGARPYDPRTDHPLLIPSFSTAGPDTAKVLTALRQAHDWVTTPPALFAHYLKYLHDHHYRVIALRDLSRYVDAAEAARTLVPNYAHLKEPTVSSPPPTARP